MPAKFMDEFDLYSFLWGCAGSFGVELLTFIRIHESGRPLPARYRRPTYFLARLLWTGMGGLFAMGYGLENPIAALHVGASAPLLIDSLSRSRFGSPEG